ncbi:MAG: class I SAM-dependent methyltransferase [Mycobacterium sp.]|nr:MAG: class I SAM-dependent methyltransferase [Mycobacterium sp.]
MALPLQAADEPNRYPIQLYHRTATQAGALAGKRVLEVGCGHGGGASYLVRALGPASYVGLDLNQAGIEFCRRRHRLPGLEFVPGDAENLPFPPQSFDAVINIESSHCYHHFDRFLGEVARVLRPGGAFLYADVRHRLECPQWEAALAGAPGLRIVAEREINTEVLRGIELNSARWTAVMDSLAPGFLRQVFRQGAPIKGSAIYRRLASGETSYRMYALAATGG